MAKLVATKKFSAKPEGKIAKGCEFETDRPEWFINLGIAEPAETTEQVIECEQED